MNPSPTSRKPNKVDDPSAAKQAVLYLRVSTTEQARRGGEAEGFSIPVQRETARARAEMLGAAVVEEFIDAGKSATTMNRDGLKALLRYVEAERPIYVIVYKLDRLSRDLANDISIRKAISAAGSQLISCSEPVDDSSPMGVMVLNMMANWNEYYSKNLGEEMKGKLIAKIRSGGTIGKAPIGYLNRVQRIGGVEVHDVVVDEVRGPLMAWVFDAFSSGDWSLNTITEEAHAKGLTTVPTRQMAEKPIPRSTLARMLRNPYYAGVLRWKGSMYPGGHQALVTKEVFDRVQSVLDSHDAGGQKQRVHNHYLKGSVFCDQCGSSMCITKTVNRHGTAYLYFFCLGRYRRRTDCTQRAIPVELVEVHIEKKWQSVQFDVEYAHQVRDLMADELVGYRETQERDKARAAKRRTQLNEQRLKLLNAHYMDAIPLELLKEEQERITRELGHTEEKLRTANVTIENIDSIMRRSLEFLANCYVTYVSATPQVRRQLNQAVFEAFMVTNAGVFIARPTQPFQTLLRTDALQAKGARAKKALANLVHDSTDWIEGRPKWIVEAEGRGARSGRSTPVFSGLGLNKDYLAEEVGFEPTVAVRPQRFSRPSDSSALALLRTDVEASRWYPTSRVVRSADSYFLLPPVGEEANQQSGGLVGQHAACHRQLVVEPGIGAQVVERAAGPGLRVGGAEHQPSHPRRHQGAGAHRARLQGDHHGDVVEPPRADHLGRVAQGQDLGVGRRVGSALALVVPGRHHHPVADGYGPDGHVAVAGGGGRLGQCQRHGGGVGEDGSRRARIRRRLGVVLGAACGSRSGSGHGPTR